MAHHATRARRRRQPVRFQDSPRRPGRRDVAVDVSWRRGGDDRPDRKSPVRNPRAGESRPDGEAARPETGRRGLNARRTLRARRAVTAALDTNLLAYAEGVNDADRQAKAIAFLGMLPADRVVLPVQVLGELFRVLTRKAGRSDAEARLAVQDRKSTRLNSSH